MQFTFAFSSQLNFRSKREAETEKRSRNMSVRTLDCVTEILETWFALEREQKKCQLRSCCVGVGPEAFSVAPVCLEQSFRCLFLGPFLPSASAFWFCLSLNLKLCCTEHTKISLFLLFPISSWCIDTWRAEMMELGEEKKQIFYCLHLHKQSGAPRSIDRLGMAVYPISNKLFSL